MMDTRNNYLAYMEELAKRHVDIAHNPADRSSTRFFLELDYEHLVGADKPNNKGWNMVVMGYESELHDRGGRLEDHVVCLFDVIKHVPTGSKPPELQAVYSQAREIGMEILMQMEAHRLNPCAAQLSDGVEVPYHFQLDGTKTIEVGPRFDGFYGYRFLSTIRMDNVPRVPNPDKWQLI